MGEKIKGKTLKHYLQGIEHVNKKMPYILWIINFEFSLLFGFSLLGIGRAGATKILIISKTQRVTLRQAQVLYVDQKEKFEKVFGETDLAGWVSKAEWIRIHNELNTIYSEGL